MSAFLDRINAALVSLSPAEQQVARLLLERPQEFSQWTAADIASKAQVSKPTVVRFCRSLGYDGLKDLKYKFGSHMKEGVPFVHRSLDADDSLNNILVKVIDDSIAALSRYRCKADRHHLDAAVAVLKECFRQRGRIEIFGLGNSGIVAQDAQFKFFRLGISTTASVDSHMQLMAASVLKGGDCAIFISNSGRTKELLSMCDIAGRNGATTIAITASGSPLAQAAAHHLAADHLEGFEAYCPMTSRLLQLTVVDVLASCLSLRIGMNELAHDIKEVQLCLLDKRVLTPSGPAGKIRANSATSSDFY